MTVSETFVITYYGDAGCGYHALFDGRGIGMVRYNGRRGTSAHDVRVEWDLDAIQSPNQCPVITI